MATLNGGLKTLSVGEQAWHSKINQNSQRLDNSFNIDSSFTRMSFDFSSITVSDFTASSHATHVTKFVGETIKVTAASGGISEGQCCSIINDSGVIKAGPTPANDVNDKVWGIAVQDIAAGSTGLILTYGICAAMIRDNQASTTYNLYDRLGLGTSTTSAGAIGPTTSATRTVALCLENAVTLDTSSNHKFLCVLVGRLGEHT